ncbi:MAG TPA: hypothetical protein DEF07_01370 [Nitrosomonas sp.]|jgi:hypothetical protein|uniref:hypothetical protein n=1 Tax=Nitrosomonas mobilis TaxID=51642 RepID=UPI000B7FC31A|nr:hypothetical protein [Nitrosomonas mobilis]HBV20354.1 hypothetical protein [Nitrosomonas sp.]HNO75913.1 hypothetical protein [Nitrosomonas mobilis]
MDKRIRIILSLDFDSNPELFAEAKRLPARARSERIRTLATVGIALCSGMRNTKISVDDKPGEVAEPVVLNKNQRAMKIARKLANCD